MKYKKSGEIAYRIIDKEAFIVTPHNSKLHTLNETGTKIFKIGKFNLCKGR